MTQTNLYRSCVGVVVMNDAGLVWSGLRVQGNLPPKTLLENRRWQFPQGGIDKGETPRQAAKRELTEETGIHSAELIYELPYWLSYDFPPELRGKMLKGNFTGQRQKWFLMRFIGDDAQIKLDAHKQIEFEDWAWRPLAQCPDIVVDFKRAIYTQIMAGFAPFCKSQSA